MPLQQHIQIDGYFIGDIHHNEVTPIVLKIQTAVSKFFPTSPGTVWKRRLHVPIAFGNNNMFMATVLLNYLQRHGRYLDLSRHKMLQHKFDTLSMRRLILYHDAWLGDLPLDRF